MKEKNEIRIADVFKKEKVFGERTDV